MGYDKSLADRIRSRLKNREDFVEKLMFGGIGFLMNGNMCCGMNNRDMVVRIGKDQYDHLLQGQYAKPFDITGRPMKGWLMIKPEGLKSDSDINHWIKLATEFVSTLPSK